jgi:hypothetical protein
MASLRRRRSEKILTVPSAQHILDLTFVRVL